MADKESTTAVNFRLSHENKRKLDVYAAYKGVTITKLLTDYIESIDFVFYVPPGGKEE